MLSASKIIGYFIQVWHATLCCDLWRRPIAVIKWRYPQPHQWKVEERYMFVCRTYVHNEPRFGQAVITTGLHIKGSWIRIQSSVSSSFASLPSLSCNPTICAEKRHKPDHFNSLIHWDIQSSFICKLAVQINIMARFCFVCFFFMSDLDLS